MSLNGLEDREYLIGGGGGGDFVKIKFKSYFAIP